MELSTFAFIMIVVACVASLISGYLVYKNFGRIALRLRNMKKNKPSIQQFQSKLVGKSFTEPPPIGTFDTLQPQNDIVNDDVNVMGAVGANFI